MDENQNSKVYTIKVIFDSGLVHQLYEKTSNINVTKFLKKIKIKDPI